MKRCQTQHHYISFQGLPLFLKLDYWLPLEREILSFLSAVRSLFLFLLIYLCFFLAFPLFFFCNVTFRYTVGLVFLHAKK
jgi:hypothetical protein